ncbi:MAG: aminotransferase class III-fold pyridoxal phosphate-dependent enzyme, partial [Betaproteobacteria bacterium]
MSTGMTNNTYLMSNLHARGLDAEDALPAMLGNENDYLTTRVSYKLNLRGPSVNVQSACSTSLVAVAQACQALLTWQCDAALAGGVSVSYPQKDGYLYLEGGIGSPDGHCRPFDERAEGTVFSNGVGVVVLRRLEDALADGQTVYAVIRGVATNNDGSAKVSFSAPSVEGQAEVIAMAHAAADISPDTIDYVEAHGTATPLGDPIEVSALTKAFRAAGVTATGYCGLGSVKSNFGHLDSAAGVAGLMKTVLALYHRQIPPTLHFEHPNPKCNFPASPFHVVAQVTDWPRHGHRRRAAVSSFGIGGTNAHVILEEAPDSAPPIVDASPSELVVISAKTSSALDAIAVRLAEYIETHTQSPLADVAQTLRLGRQPLPHRRAIVGSTHADISAALRGRDAKRVASGTVQSGTRAVAFMFPGGGTQYVDMARQLPGHAPVFGEVLDTCLAILEPSRDVRAALFPETAADRAIAAARLEQPSYGLPALFAVEYALARQWMAWGVQPTALIGHSMGEYTAACLAGVMSLENALALVFLRGRLFETLQPGEMLGVPLSESEIAPYLGSALSIAAVNAPSSCVVSGSPEALAGFAATMADAGVDCRRLHIAVAAHSVMVEPILAEFETFFSGVELYAPTIPIVSNVSGRWLGAEDARSGAYWASHLRQTVRFADGLATLLAEPNRVLLEIGPGQALSTFARQHPDRGEHHLVQPSIRHPKEDTHDLLFLQRAVGQVWANGVELDWTAFAPSAGRRRLALPTYPFEKKRFLVEPARVAAGGDIEGSPADVPGPSPHAVTPSAQPFVMTPHIVPAPPVAARPRAERICDRLIEILHKLSGVPVGEIDPNASFIEMGFDSLFLTQASLKFKAEFGVRVTFRQLFEDAPTLRALSAYIDGKMPADAFPAPKAPAPAQAASPTTGPQQAVGAPAPGSVRPSALTAPSSASVIEQVVHQQLQLMAEQLRLLGGGSTEFPIPSATTATAAPTAATDVPSSAAVQTTLAPSASSAAGLPQFGPFRGIDKSALAVTPHQQRYLDCLIERYTRRTRGSKSLTEAQRSRLADPRAVSGFRKIWKEMIYQLATTSSKGSRMWDVDGNEYIDVTSGFGVNLFGYAVPGIDDAVRAQIGKGIEIGTLSPLAKEAADLIAELTGMPRVTFANT